MFFVAGITGNVGGAAARRLLEQGHTVRSLVRNPAKAAKWSEQGVDVRQGDFNDASALAGALEGVEGAYLMLPPSLAPAPGFSEYKAMIASFREALHLAPPPRLVVLSSIGSEKTSGLGLITATHLLEEGLDGLPFPTAFIRAGSFLENYIGGMQGAAATGIFHSFWQPTDRPVPTIATADIGNLAANLLVEGWSGKKIVELGSPVSPDDLARAMGEALGRPVEAQAVPRERWTATFESFGMPPGTSGAYEEMVDSFNSGWIHFGVPGTEPVEGTITPAQFFAQVKQG